MVATVKVDTSEMERALREFGESSRQRIEVARQVRLDLSFGLVDEAQAHPIADTARDCPEREGARIPERIEQRRSVAEFLEPLPGPGEMVGFLARRGEQVAPHRLGAAGQRLSLVEGLRTDLPDVVHPQQLADPTRLAMRKLDRLGRRPGHRPRGGSLGGQRAQGGIHCAAKPFQGIGRSPQFAAARWTIRFHEGSCPDCRASFRRGDSLPLSGEALPFGLQYRGLAKACCCQTTCLGDFRPPGVALL